MHGTNPERATTGYSTGWPIGLSGDAMYDLFVNVKTLYYKLRSAIALENEYTINAASGSAADADHIDAQGIIRRVFVDGGSMYRNKFKSINRGGVVRDVADLITFDAVRGFYDLRRGAGQPENYYWFPNIQFQIVGRNGSISIGSSMLPVMSFSNIQIPSIPIDGVPKTTGISISTAVWESSIVQTERYDQITFTPQFGTVGTLVTIDCPAYQPQYNTPEYRDGFLDVTTVQFGNSSEVTPTKITHNGIVDQLTVLVPPDATTGPIKFTSVMNPAKANITTDYYQTCTQFTVFNSQVS
ncbi:hypothetical protein CCP3SC5AM1_880004 [Gammaproteobacteria bacterium]